MANCDGTVNTEYVRKGNAGSVTYDPSSTFYNAETFEKWNPKKVEGKQWSRLFDMEDMDEDYVFYQSKQYPNIYFTILKPINGDEYTRWRLYRRACINLLGELAGCGCTEEEIIDEYGAVIGEKNIRKFLSLAGNSKSNSTVFYG